MKKNEPMTLNLFFATPEKVILSEEVVSVSVPGSDGAFEVLKNHAAIFALLKQGVVEVMDCQNKKQVWSISGGYFEMSHNEATLLVDKITL